MDSTQFWSNVKRGRTKDACWIWIGPQRSNGRPIVSISGKQKQARRLAWELTFGAIPTATRFRKICDRQDCINPHHLSAFPFGDDRNASFWRRVAKGRADKCWLWIGGKTSQGYGALKFDGRQQYAHRVAWQLVIGRIPENTSYHGMCVLHRCDNPECVNPKHLFLGSVKDNIQDMIHKKRDRHLRGNDSPVAKLTERKILRIRNCYQNGDQTQAMIAERYGISRSLVSMIVTRKIWKHI